MRLIMPLRSALFRTARYLWALPYSLLGLAFGLAALLFGATARRQRGALEFAGGALGRTLARLPPSVSFAAITFGHVILGTDHGTLAQMRDHEQVHVRQYERWGPLYVPAYLLSSFIELLRGRRPYLDNYFEREAYAQAPSRPRGHSAA
jgi:hypothetical protein